MKLYEYAVIKLEKTDKDGKVIDEAEVVVPITAVLARDEDQANLLAARAIPEAAIESIDRLQVVVRPFERTVSARIDPDAWRNANLQPAVLGGGLYPSQYITTSSGTNATYTDLSSILTSG